MDKAEKVFVKYAAETGAIVGSVLAGPVGAAIGAGEDRRSRTFGGALLGALPGMAVSGYAAAVRNPYIGLAGKLLAGGGSMYGAHKGYRKAVEVNKKKNRQKDRYYKLRTEGKK